MVTSDKIQIYCSCSIILSGYPSNINHCLETSKYNVILPSVLSFCQFIHSFLIYLPVHRTLNIFNLQIKELEGRTQGKSMHNHFANLFLYFTCFFIFETAASNEIELKFGSFELFTIDKVLEKFDESPKLIIFILYQGYESGINLRQRKKNQCKDMT